MKRFYSPLFLIGFTCSLSLAAGADESWIPLFNQHDLAGWTGVHEVQFDVRDSNLHLIEGMGWLRTDQRYDDFILEFECKPLVENYDSGVFIRAGLEGKPWPDTGFQINLKQDAWGTLVRGYRPMIKSEVEGPAVGEWAAFRIEAKGEEAVLFINGEKVWEADFIEPEEGYIGIQTENRAFEFRNIRVQELGYTNLLEKEEEGFRFLKVHAGPQDAWQLTEDVVLICSGAAGGWIGTTTPDYGDFNLKLDFLVPQEGNSGVFIRHPGQGDGAYTGMEIQILDDDATHWGPLQPWQKTGSVYHEIAPSERATKEAGTWQTMQIIAEGARVTIYVNGTPIVDADLDEDKYAKSTTEAAGLKLRPRSGYIGFQNYDGDIQYRNVRVKHLR